MNSASTWVCLTGQGEDVLETSLACAVWQLETLRVLAGLITGFLLGSAGCLTQWVFRNPLAEPYVLGVTGGASLAGALALLWAWPLWAVNMASLAGALGVLAMVLTVTRRLDAIRTLLWGVMVSTLCGAAVTLLLVLSPDAQFKGLVFWLMGDLSGVVQGWDLAFPSLAVAIVAGFVMFRSRQLAQLQLGDVLALAVGVNVAQLRRWACVVAGVSVASAFGIAGGVGFVGLIAPQLMQSAAVKFNWPQHHLPILSGLCGAMLVCAADTLAQQLFAPISLPVGAVLGVVGAASLIVFILRAPRA